MTNYNERLDDVLDSVLIGMYCTNPDGDFVPLDDRNNVLRAEAKQAILDWHNKQVEEVLDRLESQVRRADDCTEDTFVVRAIRIEAERNKLKERDDDQL